jgi:8-oxo-dGTP diphosphatase
MERRIAELEERIAAAPHAPDCAAFNYDHDFVRVDADKGWCLKCFNGEDHPQHIKICNCWKSTGIPDSQKEIDRLNMVIRDLQPHKYPVAVACAVIVRAGKVLLERHAPVDEKAYLWDVPGGKVECGESPSEAVIREIREETGCTVRVLRAGSIYSSVWGNDGAPTRHWLLVSFLCELTEGEPTTSDDLQWFDLQALDGVPIKDPDKQMIRETVGIPDSVARIAPVKVHIGTSCLSRDLVWCECGRGLSRGGTWKFCPSCGRPIDQDSYRESCAEAERNGAGHYSMVDTDLVNRIAELEKEVAQLRRDLESIE